MTRQQHGAGMESGEMNTSAGLLVGWMDDWMGGWVDEISLLKASSTATSFKLDK